MPDNTDRLRFYPSTNFEIGFNLFRKHRGTNLFVFSSVNRLWKAVRAIIGVNPELEVLSKGVVFDCGEAGTSFDRSLSVEFHGVIPAYFRDRVSLKRLAICPSKMRDLNE